MTDTSIQMDIPIYTDYGQLPMTLNAKQAAAATGMSVAKMYQLMHRADFPATIIDKRYSVKKEYLRKYMDLHTRKVSGINADDLYR